MRSGLSILTDLALERKMIIGVARHPVLDEAFQLN